MEQIVFFWIGENTQVPTLLVASIRNCHGQDIKIIQVSDNETKKINGVDELIISELPKEIMTGRLKAYSKVDTVSNKTFFIDADSLMLNKIKFDNFSKGTYLTKRSKDFIINHHHPEYYPEFENKYISDVMPFLFGAIVIVNEGNIFSKLLEICMNLEMRFQRWYGDQVSLYNFYKKNNDYFSYLDQGKYLEIIDDNELITKNYVKQKISEDKVFVTFKGNQDVKRIFKFLVYSEYLSKV